jgi:KaiC/GvpD/RAD55 family RecA-like ATPase
MEDNAFYRAITRALDENLAVVRMWGDRGCGKTTFLAERAVVKAAAGQKILCVLHKRTHMKFFKTLVMEKLSEQEIYTSFAFDSLDVVFLRDVGGEIHFASSDTFLQVASGEEFNEILIDDDHLFNEIEWDQIYENGFQHAGRIISLSS